MFVIVETSNKWRGCDAVYSVYGPYATEAEALAVNADLRAHLPAWVKSHEDYDVDYTVMRVCKTISMDGAAVVVAA